MSRLRLKNLAALAVLSMGMWIAMGTTAHAATTTASSRKVGGVTISPAFQQVMVDSSSPQTTYTFSVTNNTAQSYEFSLSSVDFGSLDESGGVLFMGQTNQALNYKYGLSQYVAIGQDRIVVQPKATVKVPLTITDKESLAPGGHYGAILVSPTNVDGRPTKVEINQVLSSLLFVTKRGGETYNLALRDYTVHHHLFNAPSSVDLRFQNSGNVHVIPAGVAILTDPRGHVVKKGFVNTGSAIILPETFRHLTIPMESMGSAWLPGRYHMTVQYRILGQGAEQTKEVSFIYINGWYAIGLLIILALGVLLVLNRKLRLAVMRGMRLIGRFARRLFRRRQAR